MFGAKFGLAELDNDENWRQNVKVDDDNLLLLLLEMPHWTDEPLDDIKRPSPHFHAANEDRRNAPNLIVFVVRTQLPVCLAGWLACLMAAPTTQDYLTSPIRLPTRANQINGTHRAGRASHKSHKCQSGRSAGLLAGLPAEWTASGQQVAASEAQCACLAELGRSPLPVHGRLAFSGRLGELWKASKAHLSRPDKKKTSESEPHSHSQPGKLARHV